MKLHTISINNLKRRKAKMAFLTIGLMVGIATIVTLVTLTRSMSSDIERKMDEFGANILITPQSNGLAMNYGGISLGGVTFDQREILESDLAKIKTIKNSKNVSAVSPKVLGGITVNNHDVLLVGVHFESELKMKQWWKVFGSEPKSDQDLLLGTDAAKVLNVNPGDKLTIKGESFTVAGVLDQTGSQDDSLVFASLPKAQKLLGKEGKITLAEVAALCSGCPISDMVTQIAEKLPDAKVSAIQQVVEGRLKALDQFKRFSYAMAGVVVFIGSLIVFVTMMGSVNERTTEIGVFRAIGFRKAHIMRIILFEAALVSLLAGFLGYAAGMGGAKLALPFMAESKNAHLVWDTTVAFGSIGLALTLGLVASLYPALHASKMDPTEALRAL
ncbi:ABC transporter permease [Geobacter hydrogenophilus]|uniref:ABC transporter permease n=1 Tax=Geobacter hydrogenophilus TaxID=40983 RepID=A0A9W6G359_9BACT|nr:FtsX-like permease family protein [Geobacter hydrogenophilus]MBT0895290.1 ABC transporter permease [Geobacter hydrogenophilus]GLI39519.1 ABC transporter permease [Geobacter hydrogenophilus]